MNRRFLLTFLDQNRDYFYYMVELVRGRVTAQAISTTEVPWNNIREIELPPGPDGVDELLEYFSQGRVRKYFAAVRRAIEKLIPTPVVCRANKPAQTNTRTLTS